MDEQKPKKNHENYGHACWDLMFGVTLWQLWHWRNNKMFNKLSI